MSNFKDLHKDFIILPLDHLMTDMGISESNPTVLNEATRRDHMKDIQTPYLSIERLKGRLKAG